ncbi:hypothetical protein LEP1GSC202_3779 [Leptospira yanagawae serovar Saopaulo str. Sao Paulo = ATCC 700523]|uniref:Uncharacterized protein n=1 Tax=Leptospira yanagawae serovar Saopaulo str. Sao Paulo = ATCC 700523 TaxID=1249483 RepID=A0A5E8HJ65_9LEPT|nr:hypothetical protein LEP1GSC202_3779 [Leptospira yanagawae serovar Saopaulo str. Sao Paulo = ATCC 700523]
MPVSQSVFIGGNRNSEDCQTIHENLNQNLRSRPVKKMVALRLGNLVLPWDTQFKWLTRRVI